MNTAHTSTSYEESSTPAPLSDQQILETLNNLPVDPQLEISEKTILKEQLKDRNLSIFYRDVLNKKKHTRCYIFLSLSNFNFFLSKTQNQRMKRFSPKIAMPSSLREKAL